MSSVILAIYILRPYWSRVTNITAKLKSQHATYMENFQNIYSTNNGFSGFISLRETQFIGTDTGNSKPQTVRQQGWSFILPLGLGF